MSSLIFHDCFCILNSVNRKTGPARVQQAASQRLCWRQVLVIKLMIYQKSERIDGNPLPCAYQVRQSFQRGGGALLLEILDEDAPHSS